MSGSSPRARPACLSRRRWCGNGIALAGSALIAASHGLTFGFAALVVLAAAIAQGTYHAAQKPILSRYSGFEVTAYATWAGTLFMLPWTATLIHALPHANGRAIGAAIFLGVTPSASGFVLWGYAAARLDVARVTSALYLVPGVAILIAFLWLHQRPGALELVGGVIALAGVVTANTRPRHDRFRSLIHERLEARRLRPH